MANKRAMERASYILQMSEADEAQRNIKPAPKSSRELEAERFRTFSRTARSFEWRFEKMPRLHQAWREAALRNLEHPENKILIIQAKVAARKSKLVWPNFQHERKSKKWTGITGLCHSMKMALSTLLTNVGRGELRHGHSATVN